MSAPETVRWGILGAASIAEKNFLPSLREAGGGRAALVGSRDLDRAEIFAAENGVDEAVAGYDAIIESPDIDVVYIALPNSYHADWTIKAIEAGKPVLCEKPLCVGSAQTAAVLEEVSATPGALLWEAFVFPFQAQYLRLTELLSSGAIGEVVEVVTALHFDLDRTQDIRLSAALGGGALADVGSYPIRLAHELFAGAPGRAVGASAVREGEVETDAGGLVEYGHRRLYLSCGFRRSRDNFTMVLGRRGQVHLSNPFHPKPSDTITILRPGADAVIEHPTTDERSFAGAIRHIQAVVSGEADPLHLATGSALETSRTLEALQRLCAGN
jgi:predicted dehydrogenase